MARVIRRRFENTAAAYCNESPTGAAARFYTKGGVWGGVSSPYPVEGSQITCLISIMRPRTHDDPDVECVDSRLT